MALINCPECNKTVSNTALSCPHCGFGVAEYINKTELKQRELKEEIEKQKKRQENIEKRQEFACEIKNKGKNVLTNIKTTKADGLNQCGKKSFWVFPALLLHSIFVAFLLHTQDYINRKQVGLVREFDNFFAWFFRNWGQLFFTYIMFAFVLFFIPFGLYVISNNIKNIKIAKVLLIVGLLLCAALPVGLLVGWFASSSSTSSFDVGKFSAFFIPFVAYIFLYYETTHKKSPLC